MRALILPAYPPLPPQPVAVARLDRENVRWPRSPVRAALSGRSESETDDETESESESDGVGGSGSSASSLSEDEDLLSALGAYPGVAVSPRLTQRPQGFQVGGVNLPPPSPKTPTRWKQMTEVGAAPLLEPEPEQNPEDGRAGDMEPQIGGYLSLMIDGQSRDGAPPAEGWRHRARLRWRKLRYVRWVALILQGPTVHHFNAIGKPLIADTEVARQWSVGGPIPAHVYMAACLQLGLSSVSEPQVSERGTSSTTPQY